MGTKNTPPRINLGGQAADKGLALTKCTKVLIDLLKKALTKLL